ncbi:MAG: L,D-transpeptidase [bacterium]|nr:L,D-transpeptidase [bacterium]
MTRIAGILSIVIMLLCGCCEPSVSNAREPAGATPEGRYEEWIKGLPKELRESRYIAVVVLLEQRNYIFHQGKFVKSYVVATGSKTRFKGDRRMKPGTWWRLKGRMRKGLKPLYGPRLIRMQYYDTKKRAFVKTKKAFHGTDEPEILGTPRSRGCVYHSNKDILEVYTMLPEHTLVLVTER